MISGPGTRTPTPVEQFARDNSDLARDHDIARINATLHICERYRFVYAEVPKAACATIKLTLQALEADDPGWDRSALFLHNRMYSPLKTPLQTNFAKLRSSGLYKWVAFVRHPVARLVSAYLDKIGRNKPQKRAILTALGRHEDEFYEPLPFAEFVEGVALQPAGQRDTHWMAQSHLLLLPHLRYDFIGRFERLEQQIVILGSVIGADMTPFLRTQMQDATGADGLVARYCADPGLLREIEAIYADDFEAFGYDRPSNTTISMPPPPQDTVSPTVEPVPSDADPSDLEFWRDRWPYRDLAIAEMQELRHDDARWLMQQFGVVETRPRHFEDLAGRVLELGAGPIGLFELLEDAEVVAQDPRQAVYADQLPFATLGRRGSAMYVDTAIEAFEDASFDVVVCGGMLDQCGDWIALLQHARRVLRPGGTLMLFTTSRSAPRGGRDQVFTHEQLRYVLRLLGATDFAADACLPPLPGADSDCRHFIRAHFPPPMGHGPSIRQRD